MSKIPENAIRYVTNVWAKDIDDDMSYLTSIAYCANQAHEVVEWVDENGRYPTFEEAVKEFSRAQIMFLIELVRGEYLPTPEIKKADRAVVNFIGGKIRREFHSHLVAASYATDTPGARQLGRWVYEGFTFDEAYEDHKRMTEDETE